ncbi:hypothetical protein niasHT_037796 [Heterodera trifolii]|uniref:Helicase n=1 Tax=Heterodera trifolii TaxID=157864 RepID=A0ABD2HZ69_9BILA
MLGNHQQLTIVSANAFLLQNGLKLRKHQIEGIKTLLSWHKEGHGGILADEMGLGKTCQAIVVGAILADQIGKRMRMLVICPLSVISHWETEVSRFSCDRLTAFRYHGDNRKSLEKTSHWNVLLTTFEIFLNDHRNLPFKSWDIIVFDEAHRLKNSESLTHLALSNCKFDWLLMMTGTPIQNNLVELYALLKLAAPDQFKPNGQQSFIKRFAKLGDDEKVSRQFREIFDKYCLRRNKKILNDVPLCSEVILYHGLSKLQYDMYRAILSSNRSFFAKNTRTEKQARQSLMSTLVQLCKCCDHPYLFRGIEKEPFEEGEHLVNDSGKALILDRLLAYLHKKGHRVLIFTQMQRFLDIVYDIMSLREYICEQLDGTVSQSDRQKAIQNFQRPDSDVFAFLLTTKAGGLGLNLTAADTAIFLDWDFNPQNDKQAAARCHRIGQDKPVKIIRLVAKHTVEELIKQRAAKKLKLSENVLGTDEKEGFRVFLGLTDLEKEQKKHTQFHILTDKQLEERLGRTDQNGHWQIKGDDKENIDDQQIQDEADGRTLYMFEGYDYSEQRAAAEKAGIALGYISTNLPLPTNDDGNDQRPGTSTSTRVEGFLFDVLGDVTRPQRALSDHSKQALILHAVDDRGNFGTGGIFSALRRLSSAIPNCYEYAHRMRDLNRGDVHLVENIAVQSVPEPFKQLDDINNIKNENEPELKPKKGSNNASRTLSVALMVVQTHRTKKTNVDTQLEALEQCLLRIRLFARRFVCSVHLSRIWFDVDAIDERQVRELLDQHFCAHGINVYIYKLRRSEGKSAAAEKMEN